MSGNDSDSPLERKLKKISIHQLEEAIAKAVSELIGDECEADIKSVDFKSRGMDMFFPSCDIHLAIHETEKNIPF